MTVAGPRSLRAGVLTEMPALDPLEAHDSLSLMAASQVFETLYRYPSGELTGPA